MTKSVMDARDRRSKRAADRRERDSQHTHRARQATRTSDVQQKIGILGGSFNPVHLGHLRLARIALKELGLDRVLFVPCRIPPHKSSQELAPSRDRIAMLRLALKDEPKFQLAFHEIRRPGVSYSIDTLRRLRRDYRGARLIFLVGSDSLNELTTWKDIDQFPDLCEFAVLERPGRTTVQKNLRALPKELVVHRLQGPRLDVSSTNVRRRRTTGQSVGGIVPLDVAAYIKKRGLYCKNDGHPKTL